MKFEIQTETSEICLMNRIQKVEERISSMENEIEQMEKENVKFLNSKEMLNL